MMTAFIFLATALILLGLYLWCFKHANLESILVKGCVFGVCYYEDYFDTIKTNYIDCYLGCVIVSIIWNEDC